MNEIERIRVETLISMAMDEPLPDNIFKNRLRSCLIASIHQEHRERKNLLSRFKLVFATLLVVIISTAILMNPKIVTAFRSLLSFIPGIGLTESSTNNYFVVPGEPIVIEGVSFQVTKGYSSSQSVTLLLEIKGLSAEVLFTPDESFRFPEVIYQLKLKGEYKLDLIEKSARWDGTSGYEIRLVFPPLSKRLLEANLWLSHTPFANPDLSPVNITIPIKFELQTDSTLGLPVIDIQSPNPIIAPPVTIEQVDATEVPTAEILTEEPGIGSQENYRIEVIHLIPDVDGTILLGRVYWTSNLPKLPRFSPLSVELFDTNGLKIPTSFYPNHDDLPTKSDMWLSWGLKTNQQLEKDAYNLNFNGLTVRKLTEIRIQIPIEIVADPTLLATYDYPIEVDGIAMTLSSISLSKTAVGTNLSFMVESNNQVESVWITHERLTNVDISQLDTNRFSLNAGFSGEINITDGNLIITSIDYHLAEPISREFQVP